MKESSGGGRIPLPPKIPNLGVIKYKSTSIPVKMRSIKGEVMKFKGKVGKKDETRRMNPLEV